MKRNKKVPKDEVPHAETMENNGVLLGELQPGNLTSKNTKADAVVDAQGDLGKIQFFVSKFRKSACMHLFNKAQKKRGLTLLNVLHNLGG